MYAPARTSDHGRYLPYQTPPPPSTNAVPAPSNVFRSAEERGSVPNSRQRMSLLPHPPGDYSVSNLSSHGGRNERNPPHPGPHYGGDGGMMKMNMSESPPCKKPRLGDSKPDMNIPLRIDTDNRARSGPAYNPQVEAISPTLPSESIRDESPLRSTKEDLLLNIARVDREIAKTESQIAKLKKKKVELEEAATQPQKEAEDPSTASDSVMQSIPQSIYAENRKKAAEAHRSLLKLGPNNDLPLYNQPSDSTVYHENTARYNEFKSRLRLFFKSKQREKERRETYLTKTYAQLSIEWARNVERMENTPKKKAAEAKKREQFEKVYPELRKQREDKERFSRVSRIKSDADLEEIMDGLHEQELEDKKMRSYAVIPPALLDAKTRSRTFKNTNGLIEDPMQEYKDKQFLNCWTDSEKEIFKEKYLQHPKNFGIIKSYLERKCVADCVLYYYLSKKTENYRQLLRKSRQRPRTRNQNSQNNASAAANNQVPTVVKMENNNNNNTNNNHNNGVTTRQQKEKPEPQSVSSSGAGAQGNSSSTDGLINNTTSSSPTSVLPIIKAEDSATHAAPHSPLNDNLGGPPRNKKAKEDTKDMNDMETSDEEMEPAGDKGGPHTCVCCKTQVENFTQSRPISRNQASMYGLNENDIQPNDRVCITCRCKAVRRRTKSSQCPIPTCPAKRARIKRLRPFPPKWAELEEPRKNAIIAKYQIPENCNKCCSACFNRINRRMAPNASLETPDDPGCDTTRWNEEEIEWMKAGISEVGTDWVKLSERIPSKSELQCRNFYFNYRKKYGLEALVQEHRKSKGGHGPPTLTDEEESGSTTSSCDETGANSHDQPRPSLEKKQDDYDSSATVSAEEGNAESDKPNPHEDIKPFANNPESPLSLTIRATSSIGSSSMFPQSHSKSMSLAPPSHGIRSGSPAGPHIPSVSITPRHGQPPMHHTQISSPSPHHFASQNFPPHMQANVVHPGLGHSPLSGLPHHLTSHQGSRRYPSPDNSDNQEPMTVKVNDLLQATIERQLRIKPPASNNSSGQLHPGPSVSPTITSILKSQDRSHLPPPGSQQIMTQKHNPPNEQHHVTVTPSIFPPHQHPSYYGPTKVERIPQHHMPHEGLSLVQVPPRDECGTLDLSMKKRSPSPHMVSHRPPSNGPPPAHQPMDFAARQQAQNDMYYQSKFSAGIRGRPGQLPPPPPTKQAKVPPPPPLTKPPSLSPMKDGSITHGTPLHHTQAMPQKYEGLLRPKDQGSITQGTPMEKMRGKDAGPTYLSFERSIHDPYKRLPPGAPYFHGHAGSPSPFYAQRPPSAGQRNSPPTGHPPQTYPMDQHNNSRQIIINDYYTSQQMQPALAHSPHLPQNSMGPARPEPPKRTPIPTNMIPGSTQMYAVPPRQEVYRQSPSPSVPPHQQQRQGVIQRTTPARVVHEPGRDDAFARLVDAAASAPSLPVPNKDDQRNRVNLPRVDMVREGLGKSMAEIERNRNPQPPPQGGMYRPNMSMPQPGGGGMDAMRSAERIRMEADSRYGGRDADTTLTAASLIDAIITHQINQPSPNDRQSPAPSKSDRLFASFQRASQIPVSSHHPIVSIHNVPHPMNPAFLKQHGNEENHREDPRSTMNHKPPPPAGTWGEHINSIISNDYALGKGSSGPMPMGQGREGHGSHASQPPSTTPMHPGQNSKKEDPQEYSRNWKLRRALQRENELKEAHPDERQIIRVSHNEDRSESSHDGVENGREDSSSGPPTTVLPGLPTGERFSAKHGSKDTISPLEYVNNLIMVRMRTENMEEKEEEKSKANQESNSSSGGNHSHSSGQSSGPPVSQSNHLGSMQGATDRNEDRNEVSRFSEASQDKKDDDSRKIEESDSPASMVIDESAEETKEKVPQNSNTTESSSSAPPSQPNYEPLTDEET